VYYIKAEGLKSSWQMFFRSISPANIPGSGTDKQEPEETEAPAFL